MTAPLQPELDAGVRASLNAIAKVAPDVETFLGFLSGDTLEEALRDDPEVVAFLLAIVEREATTIAAIARVFVDATERANPQKREAFKLLGIGGAR